MSTANFQLSLHELLATADLLETPAARLDLVPVEAAGGAPAAAVAAHRHSIPRTLWKAAAHTAITVTVLIGAGAVVDPLLPHPDRPELTGPVSAPEGPSSVP